jgi:hypothetical protein
MLQDLKLRLRYNWSLIRVLYLIIGSAVIYTSIDEQQWFGIFLGVYFFLMGLLGFGCAGGNCQR